MEQVAAAEQATTAGTGKDARAPAPGPVVKWAGGKRQLLSAILPRVPRRFTGYAEPFLGGGAVLFALAPAHAIANDRNGDLVTLYRVLRDDIDALVASLGRHENTSDYYYAIRALDRDPDAYAKLTDVDRASRLVYLNRTCFNGLYRVNAKGQYNTPFGRYRNPVILNEPLLRAVHRYFRESRIELHSEDFAQTLQRVRDGAFVYLDPPYDPVSGTANFTGYQKGGFGRGEQERLREAVDDLTRRGIRFLLSNSATPFIRDLYRGYEVEIVSARRAVNADATRRGAVDEVLVRNYDPEGGLIRQFRDGKLVRVKG